MISLQNGRESGETASQTGANIRASKGRPPDLKQTDRDASRPGAGLDPLARLCTWESARGLASIATPLPCNATRGDGRGGGQLLYGHTQ